MSKKELKLFGFKMKPIGREGNRILGKEEQKIVGTICIDRNNKIVVRSENKKIKKQVQEELNKLAYQNKFYIEKNNKKFYKKPGDPLFLEALKASTWFWATRKFDGYDLVGFFEEASQKKNIIDRLISSMKGKPNKKIKIIELKEKQLGKEKKETIGNIYVDRNNNVIIESKNEKIKKVLQDNINKMIHTERAIYLRATKAYLREDNSVEEYAHFSEFKKPGDPLFLEALKESVLDNNNKIDNYILMFSVVGR